MNKHLYAAIFLTVLFAGSCKKETVVVDLGYEYFPVEIGKYVVYNVEHILIDSIVLLYDTSRYQLKEFIADEYIDNEGQLTQRIERFQRDHGTLPWVIKDVWASNRLGLSGQRVEENARIVRMAFPVRQSQQWDGNALNDEKYRPLKYQDIGVPRTVNGFYFENTTTVVTTLEPNLVDTIIDTEIRAKHIGVIYKRYVKTNTQVTGPKGVKLTMELVGYGTE